MSRFPIVGKEAPSFSLPTLKGETEAFHVYDGRPLIIDFWTTWCGACMKQFDLLQQFHESYSEQIRLVSVCSGDTVEEAREIAEEYSLTFPVFYDEGRKVAAAYQPQDEDAERRTIAFPFTVFVDPDGRVVHAKAAIFVNSQQLINLVTELGFISN